MAGRKRGASGSVTGEEPKLQAVVIADSFNSRFAPLTMTRPRALLPLCNVPLLDYTLEFLEANGVDETIVLACAFADDIREHIARSRYGTSRRTMSVRTLASPTALSLGDALREVDSKDVVRHNFILVTSDVVSNCPLGPILQQHRERAAADKDYRMTMLFKECSTLHGIRGTEEDIVVAVDPSTQRLLHYQSASEPIELPLSAVQERAALSVHYNLLDCHLALCTPQLLVDFSDNFDYQDMSRLIRGVLEADEMTTQKIHATVLKNHYAARVGDFSTYDAVTKDVLRRWAYPLTPDIFSPSIHTAKFKMTHVYLHDDVILARSCSIKESTAVGYGTRIGVDGGAATTVTKSVIGNHCMIGAGVTLDTVYMLDGTVIENNCTLSQSFLGQNVTILEGVTLGRGCILGDNVIVGPNVTLPEGTKVSTVAREEEDDGFDDDDIETPAETPTPTLDGDREVLGSKARGFVWRADADDDEGLLSHWIDVASVRRASRLVQLRLAGEALGDEDDEEAVADASGGGSEDASGSDTESSLSDIDRELEDDGLAYGYGPDTPAHDDLQTLRDNITELVEDRVMQNVMEGVEVELQGLRAGANASQHDVLDAFVQSLITCCAKTGLRGLELLSKLKACFKSARPMIEQRVSDSVDQLIILSAMESACLENDVVAVFCALVKFLYDSGMDLLDEDPIREWYNQERATHNEEDAAGDLHYAARGTLLDQFAKLIAFFDEAEEEEEDDDTSGSDEEE